jgi:hypothetical protein
MPARTPETREVSEIPVMRAWPCPRSTSVVVATHSQVAFGACILPPARQRRPDLLSNRVMAGGSRYSASGERFGCGAHGARHAAGLRQPWPACALIGVALELERHDDLGPLLQRIDGIDEFRTVIDQKSAAFLSRIANMLHATPSACVGQKASPGFVYRDGGGG